MEWTGKAFLRCIPSAAGHRMQWEQDSRQRGRAQQRPGVGTSLVGSKAVPTRPAQKAAYPVMLRFLSWREAAGVWGDSP